MNVRLVFCLQTLQVLSSVLVVGCNFYLNISDCLLVSMESNTSSVCFRSEFSDIFDLEHFKRVLAHDVRVVSSLPSTHLMSRPVEEKRTPLHVSPRWIRSKYLRRVSPFTIWSYHISTISRLSLDVRRRRYANLSKSGKVECTLAPEPTTCVTSKMPKRALDAARDFFFFWYF